MCFARAFAMLLGPEEVNFMAGDFRSKWREVEERGFEGLILLLFSTENWPF